MTDELTLATTERKCSACGEVKSLGDFYRGASYCRPCAREYQIKANARRRARMGDDAYLARMRSYQAASRKDPETREREGKINKARSRALMKLKDMYPDAYAHLLRIERSALGLKPDPGPEDKR